jgi:DnaK suppressor protein
MDTSTYRDLLTEERARLKAMRDGLAESTEGTEREPATADSSSGDHPADAGSEMFERSLDLSIVTELDAQLDDVEHALDRIGNGTYGRCEACGREIGAERLRARPAARFCVDDQAAAERDARIG